MLYLSWIYEIPDQNAGFFHFEYQSAKDIKKIRFSSVYDRNKKTII